MDQQHREAIAVRNMIIATFSDSELRDLCFDLGIDYEMLPGQGKGDKARELVSYAQRRGIFAELVALCHRLRPHIDWQASDHAASQPSSKAQTTNVSRRIFATIGALRATLDQSSPGWMLSIENIGNRELTEIAITMRPPPTVLVARPRFQIARLAAGVTSKAHSLGLKAATTVEIPYGLVYQEAGRLYRFDHMIRIEP